MNNIEIYQGNTKTIQCTVTGISTLSGYTATLTVKKRKEDTTTVIEKEGSISGLIITFDLEPEDLDVDPYEYVYEITISDGTDKYSIIQDLFVIKDSIKF